MHLSRNPVYQDLSAPFVVLYSRVMAEQVTGRCEHCGKSFNYRLCHCGFSDCSYAYCDKCGMTATLSYWDKRMPKWPVGCPRQKEICVELERHMQPCECGGAFRKGASPRCPRCGSALSPEAATAYIELNAPGTKKGWRWQRNWHDTYCIVIENRLVEDNFKMDQWRLLRESSLSSR